MQKVYLLRLSPVCVGRFNVAGVTKFCYNSEIDADSREIIFRSLCNCGVMKIRKVSQRRQNSIIHSRAFELEPCIWAPGRKQRLLPLYLVALHYPSTLNPAIKTLPI
jgi:hypothetical protein